MTSAFTWWRRTNTEGNAVERRHKTVEVDESHHEVGHTSESVQLRGGNRRRDAHGDDTEDK